MSFIGDLLRSGIEVNGDVVTIPGLNRAVGRGKTFYIDGTNGSASRGGLTPSQALLTLTGAKSKVTTLHNDTVRVIGASTSVAQAAAMDWSHSLSHVIGEAGPGMWNMRSRIEQTGTFTPFFKVSGYGNSFQNLYFMQGQNSADVVGLSVTGQRNTFQRCHILPQFATAMDSASFRLVSIDASETTFRDCTIGGDGAIMSNGALLQLGATSDGGPPRSYFENCVFWMKSDNNQAAFIDCALAGLGGGMAVFKGCTFFNLGTSLTYAILGAGLNNFQLYFDQNCSFVGVTDIVALAYENYVWFGGVNTPINQVNTASVALFNGIACHPDVS
jgi:hypothetical protein